MLPKVIFFFKQSWLVMVASLVFGLLLAATDQAWGPRIRANQLGKFAELAGAILPKAKDFEPVLEETPVKLTNGSGAMVTVYKGIDSGGETAGWAFVAEGSGFADKIKLVIIVDANYEKLAGYGVLASNETPGYGDQIKNAYFKQQFAGAPATTLTFSKSGDVQKVDSEIIGITGATVTSESMVRIFNNYVPAIQKKLTKEGLL